ncbi:MAG TPA: VOC family protein [Fimbriiglobus sp.]|jgi:PhnB protein
MPVKPIPEGYHTVTPYLICAGAAKAIECYKAAFGAKELYRMDMGGGMIAHAEIQIGDSRLMLADEFPKMAAVGPKTLGGTTVGFCLYVLDADAAVATAVAAGCTVERPIQNQFYGDRSATLIDPFGHKWTLSTHVEDVTPEEMTRRMAAHAK